VPSPHLQSAFFTSDSSTWPVRLSSVEDDARHRVCSFRERMNHAGYPYPAVSDMS